MERIEVEMTQKKQTEGTVVYADAENPFLRQIYVNKYAFKGNGGAPKRLKITIEEIVD